MLVAAVAVPLAIMACALSLSLLLVRSDPASAIRLWPNNSLAHAMLGDQLVAAFPTAPPPDARRQAVRSLEEEPGNPTASRVMGVTAGLTGDAAGLERWLTYSEHHSRREIGTELALIELAVSRGQVAGALVHYDRALRVFAPQPQLIDVLVGATATAAVREQLATLLRNNPPWRDGYLIQLVESGHAPPEAVYAMLHMLRLDAADPFDRRILSEAVALLAADGRTGLARALVGITGSGVRNGGFEAANYYPPFDWKLANDPDLAGVVEQGPRERGGNALFLDVRNDVSGIVAEQMVALPPGRYSVSTLAGDGSAMPGSAPVISVLCAGNGAALLAMPLPTGSGVARTFRSPAIAVPADCPTQRLTIAATAAEAGGPRPWVDDVQITNIR